MSKKLVVLIILDGFVLCDEDKGNVVIYVKKLNFDCFWNEYFYVIF